MADKPPHPPMSMRNLRRVHKMGDTEAWREYNRRGKKGPVPRESDINGAYLKLWRKSRGMSQEQLAGWLLCTAGSISQWERGIYQPPSNLGELLRHIDHERGTPEEQLASIMGTPTLKEVDETEPKTRFDLLREQAQRSGEIPQEEEPKSNLANLTKFNPFTK